MQSVLIKSHLIARGARGAAAAPTREHNRWERERGCAGVFLGDSQVGASPEAIPPDRCVRWLLRNATCTSPDNKTLLSEPHTDDIKIHKTRAAVYIYVCATLAAHILCTMCAADRPFLLPGRKAFARMTQQRNQTDARLCARRAREQTLLPRWNIFPKNDNACINFKTCLFPRTFLSHFSSLAGNFIPPE